MKSKSMLHDGERIVYIVYYGAIPHDVITADEGGCISFFDFNFFYGDKKDLRWYQSGGGGNMKAIQAPHFVKGTKGVTYWMASDASFRGKPKNCKAIESPKRVRGYLRSSINPFNVADKTHNYGYCDRCDQHVVDECERHQYWDDENSCVRYLDNNEISE
jgi:hypothetical protein